MRKRVVVIGGGAAGMYAAIAAAEEGSEVILLEKNEKLGKKLFITGKGRCNLTNNCDTQTVLQNVCTNRKFLYSALGSCTSADVMTFFEEEGMRLKTERGGRVFPASDHSSDVIRTLEKRLRTLGVEVLLDTEASGIGLQERADEDTGQGGQTNVKKGKKRPARFITGVYRKDGSFLEADAVVVATGGCSYPQTGSTGDGYRFALSCGHEVSKPVPALVPLVTRETWVRELMGLSLRNVEVKLGQMQEQGTDICGKPWYEGFGEMLFTHFGVSGPLMLSASSFVTGRIPQEGLRLLIDLKPALTREQLDARLLRDFEENKNRIFKNSLDALLPAKMIPVVVRLSGIRSDTPVNGITRQEREGLVRLLKSFPLTIMDTRGFQEAIITKGGVDIKGIRPRDMGSKYVEGLYFAGEVLDVDALTGGFNLQIAWATGKAAGAGAAGMSSDRQTYILT